MIDHHSKIVEQLAEMILRRLSSICEKHIYDNHIGSQTGLGCIDQIFNSRQMLEHGYMLRRPKISNFLDVKVAFDSVCHAILWRYLSVKSVPEEFISIIRLRYSNNRSQVRGCGDLSLKATARSGVFVRVVPFHFFFSVLSLRWSRRFCPILM